MTRAHASAKGRPGRKGTENVHTEPGHLSPAGGVSQLHRHHGRVVRLLIYGTAAALVFPKLFFPDVSPASGLLLSFATFGVGFVARPLGGIVFGHFGDRVGRKRMLVYSRAGNQALASCFSA
jgi:hypothetical protein